MPRPSGSCARPGGTCRNTGRCARSHSLLEICRAPDLATEVTLQPLRRLEVDAAILFSDLLLPLAPMGLPFDFIEGEGPRLERPIHGPADIDRLRGVRARERRCDYVLRRCARSSAS